MPLITIENEKLAALGAFPLSFTTREQLSVNPLYQLEFQVADADLDLSALLGDIVKVNIELPEAAGYRTFFTYVVAGFDAGQRQNQFVYRLELSSWLWFLLQNSNSRIFQDETVITIVDQVFARYPLADYRFDITESYPQKAYCVQFAESDLNFINRILEAAGLWYYIEHSDTQNTLVITDRQRFPLLERHYAQLPFLPDGEEQRAIREGIQALRRSQRIHASTIVLRDYDFLHPRNTLQTQVESDRIPLPGIPLEQYDYAAGYTDTRQGEEIARRRLEAIQCAGQRLQGESNACGLKAGYTFALIQHPDAARNCRFRLTGCDYTFVQDGPDSASTGRNVVCRFTALSEDMPWRPACTTPRPQLPGIQSATVVGAPQSEVHTDQYGRIRVHFHWDRDNSMEENSSCWIRVVQAWAGKGWGVLALPRVGQEVLVTYIDGDLDRPVVTGVVYNGENPPPYRLPDYINYSGLVSRSLRSGRPQHASQLTFDDKRGAERILIHAERDMQKSVERNDACAIGQDKYETVERTRTDWASNHISCQDISFSITGMAVSAKGGDLSSTGMHMSATGISTTFTAVRTSCGAVGSDFNGIYNGFTGISNTFTGINTGAVGINTLMIGCHSIMIGNANSMTGNSHSLTGSSSSVTGESYAMTGSSTSNTGTSVTYTGLSVATTGSATSVTGTSLSKTGSSISLTGTSFSQTGSSVTTTGSSTSTTGNSMNITGHSVTHTGSAIHMTGISLNYTGVTYSDHGLDLKTVGMQSKN
ncbi:type VI secretion system tip protein VgrG [[Erwinia] mediterraneensis]|uniref:type VI secretion system tip protein VgrG n=1 Tax=[Erwinia] mediterraneensis TaxID=2161819 RepID=UPI001030CBCC|nr:type VI secretion system tip protein VgrG [[Erwinia] mediterraneensis]